MPGTRTVVEKGFKGAAFPLAMILHLQMYTRQLGCPEFEDLKRFIRHQCEIYLDVNQTTKQQKDQVLEIVKKVQEGRPQYFDKSLSDIDIRLRRLWKYIVTSHAEARRQRSAKLRRKQRKTTSSKKPTTRARTDKQNVNPPNKQVSIGPMKTARLAILATLANSSQAKAHPNSSQSVTETSSSAIDVDSSAVESITTMGENSSSFGDSVWEVTMTASEGRYGNDFDDRVSTRPVINANAIEVPRFRLRRTLDESFVSVLGLDDSDEHREEFEAIKCHLRNFSNAQLDALKSCKFQHRMIDKAMEDLQMEWPNLFSMHVPGSENRLYFAREYLLKYHSRSASKIRIQKQQSEVKVPLHQPGRKKFKSSLGSSAVTPSTQSAPPGLDRAESTKIVESSIPQESTPEPVSTPTPSYSACQLSPFIMPLHEPPSTQSFNSSPVTSPPASYGMGQSFCSFSASSQTPRFEPSLAEAVPSKALPAGRASTLVECTRIAVESAPDTLDRQTPPSISTPTSEPPLAPSLSMSVGFTSPDAYGIDQNVFSFLRSCQPSLTHLAAVFADVGCSTHQHLFAMSCFPRTEERRYLLLKDVFKGRGVTEMESMIIERQLDFVGWIPV